MYLADLERQKQTARDIADPDEDCADDPGWQMGRRVANSETILRSWPDVERFLTKCEAAGFAFDAPGANRWVANVCDAHHNRPSEVAGWSLDQFSDMAEKGDGEAAMVGRGSDDNKTLPETTHSPDFRSIRWFGVNHTFTASQARVVKVLWLAWEQRAPEVGGETLLQAVDHEAPPISLRNLFRKHPAWGTAIVSGSSKGSYRLAASEKS